VRALSLYDTVSLKARIWHDRFVIRDIIDLHAVVRAFSYVGLENLARRHDATCADGSRDGTRISLVVSPLN
jgi:hypothetical protein